MKQSRNKTTTIIISAVFIGIFGLGFILYLSLRPAPQIRDVIQYPRPERGHDNTIDIPYGALPPPGGVHYDIWQNCGVYTEPISTANAIHSMEHGAVWITYQPELDSSSITTLERMVRGDGFILLSPYPEQRSPIVLTAWGLQLELDSVNDGRIADFIDRYRVGPQTPELGATCAGGVGNPS